MDAGFYSADYLRAWVRVGTAARVAAARGRRRTGGAGRAPASCCASLFREGTRPSTEEVAERIGYDPLDTAPLVAELS